MYMRENEINHMNEETKHIDSITNGDILLRFGNCFLICKYLLFLLKYLNQDFERMSIAFIYLSAPKVVI